MTYASIEDIPPEMREKLSDRELKIYLEAYRNAWSECPAQHTCEEKARHDYAHRIGWAAANWAGLFPHRKVD